MTQPPAMTGGGMAWNLILSSGFLAFAWHVGVLQAVERRALPVDIAEPSVGASLRL